MGKDRRAEDLPAPQGIHVMAKPAGPACNLNCDYCFYLEKKALFGGAQKYRMSDAVLRAYVEKYIAAQPTPVVEFVWQGGEPTLLGIEFFQRAVELQGPYANLKTVKNSLQTNGTLLTDEWCSFLKKNNFMVGISLDGPRDVHDFYRRDRGGKGTFDEVMRGLRLLKQHGVEYNIMACVGRETARHPLDVYRFFRDEGVEFIQFTPVVERAAGPEGRGLGLRLAAPAPLDRECGEAEVTPWTVEPEAYGDFLIAVCEQWVRNDVGKVFVMNFEWALNAWLGNPSPVCVHAQRCGGSVVLEHNGDVYACDHCVYPRFRLGSILSDSLPGMIDKSLRYSLGAAKEEALPRWCRECEVLAACRGGCPKHRFTRTYYDEPGLHYLCAGYRKFFLHIRRYLKVMAQLLANDLPVSLVMEALKGPLVIKRGNAEKEKDMQ